MNSSDVVRLLVLSGDESPGSYADALSRALPDLLPPSTECDVIALSGLPFYAERPTSSNTQLAVHRLRRAIARADGLVLVTPEHSGSLPAVLKNALDWAAVPYFSSPLSGKACAVIGVSATGGGAWRARRHLQAVLVAADANPLAPNMALGFAEGRLSPEGSINDPHVARLLRMALRRLRDRIATDREPAAARAGSGARATHLESA